MKMIRLMIFASIAFCGWTVNSGCSSDFFKKKKDKNHETEPTVEESSPGGEASPGGVGFSVAQARSWSELCERRAELPEEPRRTVEAIVSRNDSCDATAKFANPDVSAEDWLSIHDEDVIDLSPLVHLPYVRSLGLAFTKNVDLSALKKLKNLEKLGIQKTLISDFSALAEIPTLSHLMLYEQELKDLSSLANLVNLRSLLLETPEVSDVSSLRNLINLESLRIISSSITDLRPLDQMRNLKSLKIEYSIVDDAFCPKNSESLALNQVCMNMRLPCDPNNFTPYYYVSAAERSRMLEDKVLIPAGFFTSDNQGGRYMGFHVVDPKSTCPDWFSVNFHRNEVKGGIILMDIVITKDSDNREVYRLKTSESEIVIGIEKLCVVDGKEICQLYLEESAQQDKLKVLLKGLDGQAIYSNESAFHREPFFLGWAVLRQGRFFRE